MPSQSDETQIMHGSSMNTNLSHIIWIMDIIITFVVSPGENIHSTSQHRTKATFTLIRVRVTSPGFGLRLVRASPVQVSVHDQLYKDNPARVY